MSNASVVDRPIVRYPEVVAHLTTCPKCKADGGTKLRYEGIGIVGGNRDGRLGCNEGRDLDLRHWDAYSAATERIREQVKQLIRQAIVTLGVGPRDIIEPIGEALDEILDETADPEYIEKERKVEAHFERFAKTMEQRTGTPLIQGPPSDDDDRADALMALESLARQNREDDFRRLAQRKGLEHADVLWSAMRYRYLEEC